MLNENFDIKSNVCVNKWRWPSKLGANFGAVLSYDIYIYYISCLWKILNENIFIESC